MKKFLFLVLVALSALRLPAEPIRFYVGTAFDSGVSPGIYLGTLDAATGRLGPVTLACAAPNPGFLALAPGGKFLYAALGIPHADAVGAFAVGADGGLRALNEEPSGGKVVCHVSVDGAGRSVFVANYGGGIACFPVGPDGMLGARSDLKTFQGGGPNKSRQEGSHPHSIYADAADKFVYACDLGNDHVWIFRFDAPHGTLTPDDPPSAQVPPGSGPRHLAFHPTLPFVYVVNEMGVSVTVFRRDESTGALTALETVSALPANASTKGVTAAAVVCHPSGRWLYVSDRGCDTLAVFAIAGDGRLSLIQSVPSPVKFPRDFGIDPSGRWLIAAGQKDNRIAVLKIDPATGLLTATSQSASVPEPICVLFAPRKATWP